VTPVDAGRDNYVRIVAMDGKTIFSSVFNAPFVIDSSSFAEGIYNVLLQSGEMFLVQKLVVQH
jgi:hypothetical protein